ncbi:MAG: DEAD/DEAH box helicase [Prevotellamassilia sp.]
MTDTYFEDLELSDDVLDALYDMRFEKCTPVQAQCIPPILENRDVLGVAQTGTGKTAAYLLPLLTVLARDPHPADAVNCLVIAPTRELARQIDQSLQGFAYYTGIHAVAVYGGNDGARYEQERRSLQAGADIVLATPGRLITHLQLGTLDLSRTTHLVLDEADRMLDMGFADDILTIVKQMPEHRQTILFSATMPPKIADLARTVMHDPVEIEIAVSKPAENIAQSVYLCRESDKSVVLRHIFKAQPPQRVILFCSSKQKVKELAILLQRKGYNARAMHSDLQQTERDEVMQLFRARKVDLLVATDIVARGIDIDDITMVINYDAPHDAEDYVHRIGRTARAGREGSAITLIGEKDLRGLAQIEQTLKIKIPRADLPEGVVHCHEHTTATAEQPSGRKRRKNRQGGNNKVNQRVATVIGKVPPKELETSLTAKRTTNLQHANVLRNRGRDANRNRRGDSLKRTDKRQTNERLQANKRSHRYHWNKLLSAG